ncbi:unnamed protein product [Boreogadus saida]
MTSIKMTGGGGVGEATDQGPFSGPLESAPVRACFQGLIAPPISPPWLRVTDTGRVSGASAPALGAPASCAACRALPEEGLLSRHLFFSPSVDLAEAIDIFGAEVPGAQDADERFKTRGIPCLEPSLAALLCPGNGWRPNEKSLPPDRLQRQIAGLTDRVFVCASQSAVAVNNIALLSSALVSLSAGREAYGPEEAARWLAVSRFSSAILQLCQPVAVSAGWHMAWATMIQRAIWFSHTAVPERERASLIQGPLAPDGLFGPRFSEVLAHQQAVRENRSWFGAILTGSSHQQAGRKRGPGRFQRSRGPPPPPTPIPQQQSQQQPPPQPGRAAPRGQKFRKLAPTFSYFTNSVELLFDRTAVNTP